MIGGNFVVVRVDHAWYKIGLKKYLQLVGENRSAEALNASIASSGRLIGTSDKIGSDLSVYLPRAKALPKRNPSRDNRDDNGSVKIKEQPQNTMAAAVGSVTRI